MFLNLDLCGIQFELQIRNYKSFSNDEYEDNWCKVDLLIHSLPSINISINNDELLLSAEIDSLIGSLYSIINNEINETIEEISFVEPEIKFKLNPQIDLTRNSNYVYIKPGYEILDISMDLLVYFYLDGLTDNYISLRFYREDIEYLYLYLQLITNKIDKTNIKIIEMLKNGLLIEN